MPGSEWRKRRLARPVREDIPIEDDETNIAKANQTHRDFAILREKIAELKADVLICFSDDQLECFDFNNYPAFAIYVGEKFRKNPSRRAGGVDGDTLMGRHTEAGFWFNNHKELAVALLTGVMKRGFDPAFSMDMPK